MQPQDKPVLVAFDKFKDALSAEAAVAVALDVLRQLGRPAAAAPLTDGGEGFASVIAHACGGELLQVEVCGPRFAPVQGRIALVPWERVPVAGRQLLRLPASSTGQQVAFVEMASASGLELLPGSQRDPWHTSTFGTGQLLQAAVATGAGALVLGIGGSATNDCGAGALEALGLVFYDKQLQPLRRLTPATFRDVHTLGGVTHLRGRFPPLRVACDVTNPLLGEHGATRVFAPQKGLREGDWARMERMLGQFARRLLGLFGRPVADWDRLLAEPGSGAAGGIGFGLCHALADAQMVGGFELVGALLDLPARLAACGCLITGEGRLDRSSLGGKGPVALLHLAGRDCPAYFFAGAVDPAVAAQLQAQFPLLRIEAISESDWPLAEALARTPATLRAHLYEALR